jgi:DNA replicative helicase MCM subunit Mcm2 (Cdc46/Mcm family)
MSMFYQFLFNRFAIRRKCAPRLSKEAADKLASHFVEIRSQVSKYETETNARSSVPITIRYAYEVNSTSIR